MSKQIIVLGGGAAGCYSALSCRRDGMSVTLIEEREIGGTCVNEGCVPTRVFLSAIKAKEQLEPLLGPLSLPPAALAEAAAQSIRQISFGMEHLLRRGGVQVLRGRGEVCGEQRVRLPDGSILPCDALVVATGAEERIPVTHGFDRLHRTRELLKLEDLPEAITIVGAGVMGVELAVILSAVGCRVTLAEREDRVLPGWDPDISRRMAADLRLRGIQIRTGISEASGGDGVFCIGRSPRLPAGLTEEDLSSDWVYPVGDVTGREMTADTAMEAGVRVAAQIKSGVKDSVSSQTHCVFTPLEAASTGVQAGPSDCVGMAELSATAMGGITGLDGFAKAVMDKDSHILRGFHVVSGHASEVIQAGQAAVAAGMRAEDFVRMVFPHPTEGELLKSAVQSML